MTVVSGAQREFMPFRSHHGFMDEALGISMFWSEKFMIIIMYLQRLACLLLWDLDWPVYFYRRMDWLFAVLLDFTAHHDKRQRPWPRILVRRVRDHLQAGVASGLFAHFVCVGYDGPHDLAPTLLQPQLGKGPLDSRANRDYAVHERTTALFYIE